MDEDDKQGIRVGINRQVMALSDVMTLDCVLDATEALNEAARELVGALRDNGIHPDVTAGVLLGLIVGPVLREQP